MKKIWILVIAVMVLSGCSKTYMAEREFYKAQKILESVKVPEAMEVAPGTFDRAIAAFQRVVDKYPGTSKSLDSLFTLSELYMREKKYEQAQAAMKKVVLNYPESHAQVAEARFRIAAIYEMQDEWGKAETAYWETNEYHPLELRGLQAPIQVIAHYEQIRYPDAKKRAYEQALETYKKTLDKVGPIQASMQVRNYIAVAHGVMGDWAKARQEYLAIANDFPGNPNAFVFLVPAAEASQKLGQPRVALSLYEKFANGAAENKLSGPMTVRTGLIYQRLGEYKHAREAYEKALKIFGEKSAQSADVKLLIAKTYQSEGQWTEAKRRYHEVEKDYPMSVAALQIPLMIARYYQTTGDKDTANSILSSAILKYNELIQKNPNTNLAKFAGQLLNDAMMRKGDWNEIMKQMDGVIDRTEDPQEKGKMILMKALIAETQLKQKDLALNLYNLFLKNYPNHPLSQIAKSHKDNLAKA